MAERQGSGGGEGLSLQTLVIAAAASACAAIVVSHVWRGGTVIAAAMTPVIVAIVKELLARPMESEIVKKPVQQVSRIASARRAVAGEAAARTERARAASQQAGERPFEPAPLPPTEEQRPGPANGSLTEGDVLLSHPRRTYGRSRRRPVHLKVALVTGLLAFVVAALALTVPELLFGGAVSSNHSTTLFSGGGSKSGKKSGSGSGNQGGQAPSRQQPQAPTRTTPATPPSTSGGSPTSTTPAPSSPPQTTPAPTTPAPPPPSGGSPPLP